MHFHLVYSPSGGKLTRKLFGQATELRVLTDQEFVGNATCPLFVFLSCPFHIGISLPLGKRLTAVFLDTEGCE